MIKLLFILIIMASPVQAQSQNMFFESLYDVPVMPEMVELPEMALSFDKPTGRIAYATGAASKALNTVQILDFYAKSLPQMGWTALTPYEFTREDERLRLSFTKSGGADLVQFMLYPLEKSDKEQK